MNYSSGPFFPIDPRQPLIKCFAPFIWIELDGQFDNSSSEKPTYELILAQLSLAPVWLLKTTKRSTLELELLFVPTSVRKSYSTLATLKVIFGVKSIRTTGNILKPAHEGVAPGFTFSEQDSYIYNSCWCWIGCGCGFLRGSNCLEGWLTRNAKG